MGIKKQIILTGLKLGNKVKEINISENLGLKPSQLIIYTSNI